MIRVDVGALSSAVYGRIKTDAAGAAARALLGAGATSVIHAEDLTAAPLPARPMVALRAGIITERTGILVVRYTWYVYDDPAQRYWRINGLLHPIAAAYDLRATPLALPTIPINAIDAADAGPETSDPALGLLVRSLALYAYT